MLNIFSFSKPYLIRFDDSDYFFYFSHKNFEKSYDEDFRNYPKRQTQIAYKFLNKVNTLLFCLSK